MAKGVNGLLGDEDGTACAAMLALGQTGFGASRRLGGVDDLSMTGRINLSYLLGTAMTAGLGLFALLGAGGLSGDDPLAPSMAKGVDLFLGDKNLVADRAVLALGLARRGAVGSDGCVDDLSVALSRKDSFGSLLALATDRAVDAAGDTSLGAGSFHVLDHTVGVVTLSVDNGLGSVFAIVASGAVGTTDDAGLGAGGILVLDLAISFMTKGGKRRWGDGDFATDRAHFTFGLTGRGAGGINGRFIDKLGVTLGRDGFLRLLLSVAAAFAVFTALDTVFGAGCVFMFNRGPVMLDGDCVRCLMIVVPCKITFTLMDNSGDTFTDAFYGCFRNISRLSPVIFSPFRNNSDHTTV